jgi:hypothetical protein
LSPISGHWPADSRRLRYSGRQGDPHGHALFRPAVDLLKQYAEYHRDRRNIVTHFVGVPMIVFAIGVLLAGVSFTLGGWPHASLAGVQPGGAVVPDTWAPRPGRGHHAGWAGCMVLLAHRVSGGPMGQWLAWGGLLRRRLDHPVHRPLLRRPQAGLCRRHRGLLVGPMFVVLEMLAPLGCSRT